MAIFSLVSNESPTIGPSVLTGGLARLIDDLDTFSDSDDIAPPSSLREALFHRIEGEPARVRTDANGLITATNPAFSKLCGYSFHEIRGRKPGSFLHGPLTEPDLIDKVRGALAARETVQVDLTNYHKDGSPYRVKIIIRPLFEDGQFAGFEAEERKLN